MAGYACELCSGQEGATLLITPLTGGETMAVGPDCVGTALTGMLSAALDLDVDKLADAIDRLTKARDRQAAKQADKAPAEGPAKGQADERGQAAKDDKTEEVPA